MRRISLCKLLGRDIPFLMAGLIFISGLFNGSYNPFSSSLISTIPVEFHPIIDSIGNRSAAAVTNTTDYNNRVLKQNQIKKKLTTPDVDALFHYQPAFYIDRHPKVSSVHCVGESFANEALIVNNSTNNATLFTATSTVNGIDTSSSTSFIYRSCAFQNLCFDVSSKEFVIISSETSLSANQMVRKKPPRFQQIYKSTSWDNNSISLGPIAQRWTDEDRRAFEWFPKVVRQQDIKGYYQLDPRLVLVPFALHGASNPGHALWDNFLPIYKLLTMFDLCWNNGSNATDATPLLIHFPINNFIFGACSRHQQNVCDKMVRKLLPLLGLPDHHFVSTKNIRFKCTANNALHHTSALVCANAGAAGLGMLSDHATKEHGQYNQDFQYIHNVGKGNLVFKYRNFIMTNMGLATPDRTQLPRKRPPYRVTVATNSSDDPKRLFSFDKQIKAIQSKFSTDQIVVEKFIMRHLSLADQLKIASESFFYLSACGGSVMTATFLPRGASLVLFYANNRYRRLPSYLDYDLLNNLPYIRVHWFAKSQMNKPDFVNLLVLLIQHELDFLML